MSSKGSIDKFGNMKPNLSCEVPDTPNRIARFVNLQHNRVNQDTSRNLRLNVNHRTCPVTINPSSLTTPSDNERKRKSCSSGISIPGSSNNNSRCNKKGKNVVQEAGEEGNRGPAARDNKGKGKLDFCANSSDVQEKSPDQPDMNLPKRRVGQRWLVRNGMICPSNIVKRNFVSSSEGTGGDADALKSSEVEAVIKVSAQPPSAVVLHESCERVPRPAASHSVAAAAENAIVSEIVSDDLYEGLKRSRRDLGATTSTSTSSWRSTHSNRPGPFDRTSTGSSRPNPAVSTASIPVTARPTFRPYTLTNTTEGTGPRPRPSGRIRSSASLHDGKSSSRTRNPGPQPIDLTTPARSRGRSSRSQRAEAVPVIDLDEIHLPDSGATRRARQLAHDEMFARQLQEQFYNEMPVDWGTEEMDRRIAMSLQQEENTMHAPPIAPRAPLAERSTQFMAASSLVRNNSAQQMRRDFNPEDYEALLALDEDNHQHTGASTSQINNLPESVVKSDNFGESCIVCLETPSVGEKIRHLPCLHKFHKDCIDQWLQRKKECPVCKCGII